MPDPSIVNSYPYPTSSTNYGGSVIFSASSSPVKKDARAQGVQDAEALVKSTYDKWQAEIKNVKALLAGGVDVSDPAAFQKALDARKAASVAYQNAQKGFDTAKKRAGLGSAMAAGQFSAALGTTATTSKDTGGLTSPPIPNYTYNLPPVKDTYFAEGNTSPTTDPNSGLLDRMAERTGNTATTSVSSGSPQYQSVGKSLAPNLYSAGSSAWVNGAGRGTIQMSRDQMQFASKSAKSLDRTAYGFRFMYNPSSVSMTWGIPEIGVNWEYIASGKDKSSAGALGLLKSTVSFSVLLNRVEDFKYILGPGGGLKPNAKDPYSGGSIPRERAEIYKKGTMYDMEYLFRVLTFPAGRYDSSVGGFKTNDVGWINPQPVELHLGDGLRYKVRIESLSINHAMFNERMVPILSTVDITCTRYFDGMYSDWQTAK